MKIKTILSMMLVFVLCLGYVSAEHLQDPLTTTGRNTINATILHNGTLESMGGLSTSFNMTLINITHHQKSVSPDCISNNIEYYTEVWLNATKGYPINISHLIFELPDTKIINTSNTTFKLQYSSGNATTGGEFYANGWCEGGASSVTKFCINFTNSNGGDLNLTIGTSGTKINLTYSLPDVVDTYSETINPACSYKKTLDYSLISAGDYLNISGCSVKLDPPGTIEKIHTVWFDGGSASYNLVSGFISYSSAYKFTNGTTRSAKIIYEKDNQCGDDDDDVVVTTPATTGAPQKPVLISTTPTARIKHFIDTMGYYVQDLLYRIAQTIKR